MSKEGKKSGRLPKQNSGLIGIAEKAGAKVIPLSNGNVILDFGDKDKKFKIPESGKADSGMARQISSRCQRVNGNS